MGALNRLPVLAIMKHPLLGSVEVTGVRSLAISATVWEAPYALVAVTKLQTDVVNFFLFFFFPVTD